MGILLCQACSNGGNADLENDIADSATPALVRFSMLAAGPLDGYVEIVIDGEVRARRTEYLRHEDYLQSSTRIETRHKETGIILSSAIIRPVCAMNLNIEFGNIVATESQAVCVSRSGYISGYSDTCCSGTQNVSSCFDSFCPKCSPLWENPTCAAGEHCGLVLAHENPPVVHTRCLSQGSVEIGESCSFATPGPDGVDECVAGSGCIDNTCRAFCSLETDGCETGFTCVAAPVLSTANRLGACLP